MKQFGILKGQPVFLHTIENEFLQVEVLDYGATIRAIRTRDRAGSWTDVCLGYETIEEYCRNNGYLGATVGRCANRIAGASFDLNGETCVLPPNEGKNQLHGGPGGFHQKIWNCAQANGDSLNFELDSPDGEEGYPGNLHVKVTFTLKKRGLVLDYGAVSDRDTVVNLTNHAYFNLAGQDGGPVYDHVLAINADRYTPVDPALIPTGELAPVEGTLLDLRSGVTLGERLNDPKLAATGGYDHNFALNGENAARLWCPRTGIGMEVRTCMEGIQLYTGGGLSERAGKDGARYGTHHALCLETQHFPNAINQPNFPSPVLRAGEKYRAWTEYRFFVEEAE